MYNHGLFKLHPLVPLCVSLVGGIMLGEAFSMAIEYAYWFCAFLFVFVVTLFLWNKPACQTYSILLCAVLLGGTLSALAEHNMRVTLPDGEMRYEAVVSSEAVERGRTMRFDMIITSGAFCGRTVRASLLKDTVAGRYRNLHVGDGIVVRSALRSPKNFMRSNFDYVTYLKGRGIIATTFIYYRNWRKEAISLTGLSYLERARLSALSFRHTLLHRYRALGLDGQGFAVIAAMTLGDKSAISTDVRDAYSISGASHILALSGMHLGIIYALLSMLSLGRRFSDVRECLLLLSIWAYVFMVGMSSSVFRAALMITVYSLAGLSGRDRMSVNALAFAAMFILVINPLSLYDIGFQLSFMAVAFILVFQSTFVMYLSPRFLQEHRVVRWVWHLLVMSCLAQFGTAPLVAYYFGRLPVYFLLTNILVIPAATVILYASAAMMALSFIPVLQQTVATLLMLTVTGLNAALLNISSLPCASFDGIHINGVQVFLIYVAIISLFSAVHLLRPCRRDA